MNAIAFLGVSFANCHLPEVLNRIMQASSGDSFHYVVTPNVDHVVLLSEEGDEPWRVAMRDAVKHSDLCINDSRILSHLARLSGKRLPVVPGSDLTREVIARLQERTGTIALVGGRQPELDWLRTALPNHKVLHLDPPMGVRDNLETQRAIAEFIETAQADIIFLAIGAPQSEIVARLISRRQKARGVALCIGASIEFLSGSKVRAPSLIQRLSLEWLHRLASEPRRLAYRYLIRGPRIFAVWWRLERRKG